MTDPDDLPMSRSERIRLGLLGGLAGVLMICAPTLIGWWIIWSSEQLDAIAALLGWR